VRLSAVILLTILFPGKSISQQSGTQSLQQFLLPKFTEGSVKIRNGGSQPLVLNYNMVDEEMIFSQRGTYMALTKPEDIDTVYIGTRKFVPFGNAFYEVVVTDKMPFFIQHKSKYTSKGTATAYGMTSQTNQRTNLTSVKSAGQIRNLEMPDDVTVVPEIVYWVKVNSEMKKFTTERQLTKLFPENEEDLKKFIKSSSIDLHNREDLIKLGKYCNEIMR
jgi:hypothetical protein